jgi:hypothetical protein
MDSLILEPSETSPRVDFNPEGKFLFEGESRPENVVKFYGPVLNWLKEFAKSRNDSSPSIEFDFRLEYFNSSSAKFIMDVFLELENAVKNGLKLNVNWYYDEMDEDLLESGEEYQKLVEIPFKFFPIVE